jgi:hypothetical protein
MLKMLLSFGFPHAHLHARRIPGVTAAMMSICGIILTIAEEAFISKQQEGFTSNSSY